MKEGIVYSDDGSVRLGYTLRDDGTFFVDVMATKFGSMVHSSCSKPSNNSYVNLNGKVEDRDRD